MYEKYDPWIRSSLFCFFPGTDLSKKHIRKSSSNSKITGPSNNENQLQSNTNSKVRTIEIKRETEPADTGNNPGMPISVVEFLTESIMV